jgi:hypothetical protein
MKIESAELKQLKDCSVCYIYHLLYDDLFVEIFC